jgi:cytochrome-b5 reductase
MVKQYPNGKASTHLHSLTPGDSLFFVTRLPGYAYTPNEFARVTLIAGGMGITPIYQLAAAILANPADTTRVEVVCGVNSDADVLLHDEFAEWERRFPGRFKASWVVSHPAAGSAHPQGYVTGELLRRATEAPSPDAKVFVSGPPAMEEALVGSWKKKGVLEELGYTKQQVHKF